VQTVSASFVREHGDKFTQKVILGYGKEKIQSTVGVDVYLMKQYAHVSFAKGWKNFVVSHNIKKGNRLQFQLVEHSAFNVLHFVATNATN